jgi:two-component system sensor histidine kinase EvgS
LTARNGEQGVQLYEQHFHFVKMIFSDFEMPVLSGPQMVEKIRKIEKENNIDATVIIGLTGNDSQQAQSEGLQCGMNLVIKKPPNLKDFKKLFSEYLFNADVGAVSSD